MGFGLAAPLDRRDSWRLAKQRSAKGLEQRLGWPLVIQAGVSAQSCYCLSLVEQESSSRCGFFLSHCSMMLALLCPRAHTRRCGGAAHSCIVQGPAFQGDQLLCAPHLPGLNPLQPFHTQLPCGYQRRGITGCSSWAHIAEFCLLWLPMAGERVPLGPGVCGRARVMLRIAMMFCSFKLPAVKDVFQCVLSK